MSRPMNGQLSTARIIRAQFTVQIAEYEAMNRRQRRTPRGRDLTARIDGLREGHATWTKNVANLEAQLPPETETP